MSKAQFAEDGFVWVAQAVPSALVVTLGERCAARELERAGDRHVLDEPWCRDLAQALRCKLADLGLMPRGHVAIQCTLFEKSADRNWLVGLHQDLSVPVAATCVDEGWPGYSVKGGSTFVRAPGDLLADLIAVRVHLDDCGEEDGPLGVVPGSHVFGPLEAQTSLGLRDALGMVRCVAAAGDVLVMRPALLHASSKARGDSRRRVLHFLYAPGRVASGLMWASAV